MKTNNYLYLAVLLVFGGCTSKTPEIKTPESKQDSLPENICIEQPSDTIVADTIVPPSPKRVKFIPPVIVDCEDLVTETICSYPEYIEPEPKTSESEKPFQIVDQMPVFPGGDSALFKFISENLKYPNNESCIEGRVVLRFVVDKEGDIKDVEVLRSLHPEFDNEAIRVVKSMPKWNVGKQNGVSVDAYYTLPILFRLTK